MLAELREHKENRRLYPRAEGVANLHTCSGFFCSSSIAACYMKWDSCPRSGRRNETRTAQREREGRREGRKGEKGGKEEGMREEGREGEEYV